MIDDDNFIHKYYAPFLSSINHENVSFGSEYDLAKRRVCRHKNIILDLLLNQSKSLDWRVYYFLLSTTRNCHHIWFSSVNTLIPQITKFIPMIN